MPEAHSVPLTGLPLIVPCPKAAVVWSARMSQSRKAAFTLAWAGTPVIEIFP